MILALLGAIAIGTSLGLLGSGGSILTLPVLIVLLHRPDKLAIAESLAIIGSIAAVAAIPYALRRQVDLRSVAFFGLAGMAGAYLGACCSPYLDGRVQIGLFAIVMLIVAWKMLFGQPLSPPQNVSPYPVWKIMGNGCAVGTLTGLLGVGGGFLIMPALVLLNGLTMHVAIGTSLVIIAMNCLGGFFKQLAGLHALELQVSWPFIGLFVLVGILGSAVGHVISGYLNQVQLRRLFGGFVFLIGIYMLIRVM